MFNRAIAFVSFNPPNAEFKIIVFNRSYREIQAFLVAQLVKNPPAMQDTLV